MFRARAVQAPARPERGKLTGIEDPSPAREPAQRIGLPWSAAGASAVSLSEACARQQERPARLMEGPAHGDLPAHTPSTYHLPARRSPGEGTRPTPARDGYHPVQHEG